MAKNIDALIRKKQRERERLMKQVREIDVVLEALGAAGKSSVKLKKPACDHDLVLKAGGGPYEYVCTLCGKIADLEQRI